MPSRVIPRCALKILDYNLLSIMRTKCKLVVTWMVYFHKIINYQAPPRIINDHKKCLTATSGYQPEFLCDHPTIRDIVQLVLQYYMRWNLRWNSTVTFQNGETTIIDSLNRFSVLIIKAVQQHFTVSTLRWMKEL